MTSLGLFDPGLLPGGVFDELLVKEAWFDLEIFVTPSVIPVPPTPVPTPVAGKRLVLGSFGRVSSQVQLASLRTGAPTATVGRVSQLQLASNLQDRGKLGLGPLRLKK